MKLVSVDEAVVALIEFLHETLDEAE